MAGIQGLDLTQSAIEKVEGVFNRKDWVYWATFNINNESVDFDNMGMDWDENHPEKAWKEFVEELPENEPRYCLSNFGSLGSDGIIRDKIVFVMWIPSTANIKSRLQTTMHSLDIQRQMKSKGPLQITLQANERSDLHYAIVLDKIKQLTYCF